MKRIPSPLPLATVETALVLAAALALPGCAREAAAPAARPSVPVVVATAEQRDVPVELRAIGTVEPFETVTVRPQVAGVVDAVHIEEGADVRKGQALFTLDARELQAQVRRAEAQLARDRAQLENARADERRLAALHRQQLVSSADYDKARTAVATGEETVAAGEAAAEDARVNAGYTRIVAPMAGRLGRLLVYPGGVVKANETPLVSINRVQPVKVAFSVPESRLSEVRRRAAGGDLPVEAWPRSGEDGPGAGDDADPAGAAGGAATAAPRGRLDFIDNSVDQATGTILLKGVFANEDRALWPGQYVTVRLVLATRPGATVVPASAVQSGQQGDFVFVVAGDGTASSRPVRVAALLGADAVIDEGIAPGDVVVTDGQLRLVPGARVEARRAEASR